MLVCDGNQGFFLSKESNAEQTLNFETNQTYDFCYCCCYMFYLCCVKYV